MFGVVNLVLEYSWVHRKYRIKKKFEPFERSNGGVVSHALRLLAEDGTDEANV